MPPTEPSRLLTVYAPRGIARIAAGDDLGDIICRALAADRIDLRSGDVLVVASKVVAKAEGAVEPAPDRRAFERRVEAESAHLVAQRRFGARSRVQIVRTRTGSVQAAAGLDRSNLDGDGTGVLLQPRDPSASARALRDEVRRRFGASVGVIVSDSAARPWRVGVSDFALGASGVRCADSQRGLPDDSGRTQTTTVRAVADAVAQAADLVKGSARGLPVAVVRGVSELVDEDCEGVAELVRPLAEDWFRHGHVEAVHAALGCDPAGVDPQAADGEDDVLTRVTRALAVARASDPRTPGQDSWRLRASGSGSRIDIARAEAPAEPSTGGHPLVEAAVGLGALVERVRTALWAEDLDATTRWTWDAQGAPAGAALLVSLAPPEERRLP